MNKIEMNLYYKQLIDAEEDVSRKAGWRDVLAQNRRFQQLYKLVEGCNNIDVADIGCGLAEFYNFLNKQNLTFCYTGYDLSEDMIDAAGENINSTDNDFQLKLVDTIDDVDSHDFIVSSGIFNMKRDIENEQWHQYIIEQLNKMNNKVLKGFAFNMLTSYSDKEFMKNELYYGNPTFFFDYCKQHFSKNIALLHDYDEYDFTVIVRK